jgi:alcohol dehydrogenase (cytochrome c)
MLRRFAGWPLTCIALAACNQLAFLKPPSVPTPRGSTFLERGPAFEISVAAGDPADDWLTYNRSFEGTRGSPLAEIDTGNVARLRQLCSFDLGQRVPFQTGPVVVGGTMYVTTALHTYALDAATCSLRWKHTYRYTPPPPFDLEVNRGVGYADGRLFRGANDGRVYAIDASTGKEMWNVVAGNVEKGETFPAAPIAWDGMVFIGNAGGDNFGVIGRMMAFDANTGGRLWTADLVPQSGPASRSWPPHTEVLPKGGGATWTSYTLDTLSGSLFVATGNAAPDFLLDARPGDNLYTYSVVELDLRLGTIRRWRQLLQQDAHDWDFAAPPALVTTASGAQLVVQAGKDGFVYGIERKNGAIRYRTPVTRRENTEAPLTAEGTRFCPGVNGGVEWNGPTYAPELNMLFVNAIDWCTTVRVAPVSELEGKDGIPWTGTARLREPFGQPDTVRAGWLTALDADDGTVRWQWHAPTPLVAGVTSTAGGLVFTGDLTGAVLAFDARTGRLRWRHETGLPIGGGVVTYRAGGRQLVAVAAGMHAPVTWQLESDFAKVIVFGLPGEGSSPPDRENVQGRRSETTRSTSTIRPIMQRLTAFLRGWSTRVTSAPSTRI